MKKTTRRALFLSFAAMFLCFTMLLGTTYAWFTDSVESDVNKIVAGNLDVELYNGLDTTATPVDGTTKLFDLPAGTNGRWEPGAMVYENFTVANKGDLALKYQLSLNAANATEITDADGNKHSFASMLKVLVVEGGIDGDTRDDLKAEAGWKALETFTLPGDLTKGENDVYGIAIWWEPSDKDNLFNMNNGKTDTVSIDLGVKLYATQLDAEFDSFGNDYDKDAVYAEHYAATAEELAEALTAGGSVALMNDIDLSVVNTMATGHVGLVIPANVNATIDLNGFTLSDVSTAIGKNYDMIDVRGTLTVKNGNIVYKHEGDNMGWSNSTNVFNVTAGGVLNIENATVRNLGGSDMAFVAHLNNWGEVTLNVDNSTLFSTYAAVRVFNSGNDMNNVSITNSTITGANMAFWVHNYTVADFGTQEKVDKQDALLNFNFIVDEPVVVAEAYDASNLVAAANNTFNGKIRYGFTDGFIYYTTNASAVTNDAKDIDAALTEGKNVYLTDDTTINANDTTNSGYGPAGVVLNGSTVDGNGNTITVTNANGDYGAAVYAKSGTIKNATVSGAFRGIFTGGTSGDLYIDNVVIDNVCYTFNSDAGDKNYGVYISNSTLNGWTSYSNAHKEVVFTNCSFGQGTGAYDYAFCRPYNASVFENCVFEEGFEFDTARTSDIVFINCYYGVTLITAENAATLGTGDTTFFYNGINGITIK